MTNLTNAMNNTPVSTVVPSTVPPPTPPTVNTPTVPAPQVPATVPAPVAAPAVPGVGQAAQNAPQGQTSATNEPMKFEVNLQYSTLMGEPTDAEKRRIAAWIKPEIEAMIALASRRN